MPFAVLPLWQDEQLVSVALWAKVPPPQLAKPPDTALAWHEAQSDPFVATWPAIRRRSHRALGALAGVRARVTGVAAHRRHRGVVHRVGGEARRRVDVAVRALQRAGRQVRRRRHALCGLAVVAGRTVRVGRLMREDRLGETDGGGMAGFAGNVRRAVRGRLADCGLAIVAVGAACHDPGVIHLHGHPEACRRLVTGIAGGPGRDVARRLARCHLAVVACRTAGSRLHVVDPADILPGRGLMTTFAAGRGLRMAHGHASRLRAVMAARTPRLGPLEAATNMAGRTLHCGVAAGQRKPGREMVERRPRTLRGRGDRGREHEQAGDDRAPDDGTRPTHQQRQMAAALYQPDLRLRSPTPGSPEMHVQPPDVSQSKAVRRSACALASWPPVDAVCRSPVQRGGFRIPIHPPASTPRTLLPLCFPLRLSTNQINSSAIAMVTAQRHQT